jgi:TIR domain
VVDIKRIGEDREVRSGTSRYQIAIGELASVRYHPADMAPQVFISYSHDNQEHMDRLWDLSERLRRDGVDCRIDQQEESPAEGWPRWCRNQVQEAQFVLIACTETYLRRYEGKEWAGKELGGQWGGFVITQELYESEGKYAKFIPLMFSSLDSQYISVDLRGGTQYNLSGAEDYEKLFRRITNQVAQKLAAVPSSARTMPMLQRKAAAPVQLLVGPETDFDVYLIHAHVDAKEVEILASRLADEAGFRVWLDKWILVPGGHWQPKMAEGLGQAHTCAVCIGRQTPKGWFQDEIERALNRQTKDESFRVIPVILPDGDLAIVDNFLELRTWVDFSEGLRSGEAFHTLVAGIKGVPPGRARRDHLVDEDLLALREPLSRLGILKSEKLIDDDIAREYQRKLLDRLIK